MTSARTMFLAGLLVLVCWVIPAAADEEPHFPEILAMVNGEAIRYSAVHDLLADSVQQWEAANGKQADRDVVFELATRIVQMEIQNRVVEQECQKFMIDVSEEEMQRQLEQMIVMSGGRKQFQEQLEQMKVSEETLKSRILRSMAVKKLVQQQVVDQITVSDEEIQAYYTHNMKRFASPASVDVSHIVIEVRPDASPEEHSEAEKKARQILKQLQGGADFEALAGEFSQDPSRFAGGKVGVLKKGFMPPEFDEVAFNLQEGEISDVVKTHFGYHIIKANKVTRADVVPLEQAKAGISMVIKKGKLEMQEREYLRKLLENAKIHMFI